MRKHLLTGLVILLPVALTLMVIVFLFDLFTEPLINIVGPLVHQLQEQLHITLPQGLILFLSRVFSLIFLCLFIIILGVITQLFLVKILLNWANQVLFKIPLIKTVYKVSKEIFSALLSTDGKKAFKKVVMTPFPNQPTYSLGFEAGQVPEECNEKAEAPLVSVFIPTAPHPISGFLLLIPKTQAHSVEMSNEEGVKYLVSCGMIVPEERSSNEPST